VSTFVAAPSPGTTCDVQGWVNLQTIEGDDVFGSVDGLVVVADKPDAVRRYRGILYRGELIVLCYYMDEPLEFSWCDELGCMNV
jgi:hypothetical protein